MQPALHQMAQPELCILDEPSPAEGGALYQIQSQSRLLVSRQHSHCCKGQAYQMSCIALGREPEGRQQSALRCTAPDHTVAPAWCAICMTVHNP